jgi:hypothetical protein
MALQRMILVPPELWENRCKTPTPPPPVKEILNSKDNSYDKWTRVRIHQDPFLKVEKQKREPIPVPIIERKTDNPKRVLPVETGSSSIHSKYIHNISKRKLSHDPTFGVYRDDTDGSFKIGRSRFKYNNKYVFVDGKKYKATDGLWELLSKAKPDKNTVTLQDRQAYKRILLQSNAHRVNYSPTGKIKANKSLKYTRFVSKLFKDTNNIPWESVE